MDTVKKKIDDILLMTNNDKTREKISKFIMEDVKTYSAKLVKLDQRIKDKSISMDKATKMYSLFSNDIMRKAVKLEKIVEGGTIRMIKEVFRMSLIDSPVYKSLIAKRGHDRPRGYPGDYQIIETFYENKPISKGIGFCGDKYFLNENYVKAVRRRKDDMKELLRDFIENTKLKSINILNLGCGSCREIRELFLKNYKTEKKILFTLVDQDDEALQFARETFKSLSKHIPRNVKFKFIKKDVYSILGDKKNKKNLNGQDMIYSIGLADYLPDIYLGRLIKSCYDLLELNGKLIIAHKDVKKYSAPVPDWFGNWYFFPRNRIDIADIIETYMDKNKFKMDVKEGKSKRIFFIEISKQ